MIDSFSPSISFDRHAIQSMLLHALTEGKNTMGLLGGHDGCLNTLEQCSPQCSNFTLPHERVLQIVAGWRSEGITPQGVYFYVENEELDLSQVQAWKQKLLAIDTAFDDVIFIAVYLDKKGCLECLAYRCIEDQLMTVAIAMSEGG
ncbi:MAG: hypothetical protein HQM07_04435 [Zetaproteobacteria bacterium]|nr:hypothetical protein [Zetaproteobacteria bacterium]